MRKLIIGCCLAATLSIVGLSAVTGQEGFVIRSQPIVLYTSPIQPLTEQRVPARVSGVLAEILVSEGDQVKKGQVLATIDDRIALLDLEAKQLEAKNTSLVGGATARLEEANAAAEDAERLFEKRVLAPSQMRLEQAKVKVATQQLIDAEVKFKLAGIDEKRAEYEVERHRIVSEIDGIVDLQVRQVGEAVQALDPIFRVTRTDKVKVEGALHIRYKDRVSEGMAIDVYPELTAPDDAVFQHTADVNAVQVLPGDKVVAAGTADGAVYLWDVTSGRQTGVLVGHEGDVDCLATVARAPNMLVSGGMDGSLIVWNVDEMAEKRTIRTGQRIRAVALNPLDASICYTSHDDRSIRIYDLQKGTRVDTLPSGHFNYATSLEVTSDGKFMVSIADDETARLWDLDGRKELKRFSGRTSQVTQIGLSPDNSTFLFNSQALLQIRRIPDGQPLARFENRTGVFDGVAVFLPIKDLVLTANSQSDLQLWQTGQEGMPARLVRTYEGHGSRINRVAVASNGAYFASASDDRTVRIWRVPPMEQIEKERTRGVISFMSPQGEAGSSTITIHAEVDNKDNTLTPGSFATIVIYPDVKQQPPTTAKLRALNVQ